MRLAIDGEAGIGRTRLPWEKGGELIERLGTLIADRNLSPIVCAELLADFALEAQLELEFDRLHKKFRSLACKSVK